MSKNYNLGPAICTVISGSFRKHLTEMSFLKKALEKLDICVLSPEKCSAVNPEEEFIILDSDPVCHPGILQSSVFAKMRRSTFLVLANFDGYIGRAAAVEIGYAIAIGIKIYSLTEVEDPNIAPYCSLLTEVFPEIQHIFSESSKSKKFASL